MAHRLKETLFRVRELAKYDFSGIGLVVHQPFVQLPTFPLRLGITVPDVHDTESLLAAVASNQSDFHDGFHLLSTDWKITALAQYFSPPIVANVEVKWQRKFGGRYLAAQFGSMLPGVELCGIATNSLGLAIFKSGREIFFERI